MYFCQYKTIAVRSNLNIGNIPLLEIAAQNDDRDTGLITAINFVQVLMSALPWIPRSSRGMTGDGVRESSLTSVSIRI
jgi:hypothetical protein